MKTGLINQYLQNNEITFVGTFSRYNMVKPWFDALEKMQLPRNKIHLLIYDNSQSSLLSIALKDKCSHLKKSFLSVDYYYSGRRGGTTLNGQSNDNFETSKLKPIWEMWKDIKDMIKTEIFFLVEDDTVAPPNAFNVLVEDLLTLENASFVTGIETGRGVLPWQNVRLGVHNMEVVNNKVLKRISLDPNSEGIHKIDGSGVYCFACFTKDYQDAFGTMDEWVDQVPFFAMDNILTYNMKLNGKELYADFSIWCDHLHQSGGQLFPFNKKQAVIMADLWIPEFNSYAQGIEIKN